MPDSNENILKRHLCFRLFKQEFRKKLEFLQEFHSRRKERVKTELAREETFLSERELQPVSFPYRRAMMNEFWMEYTDWDRVLSIYNSDLYISLDLTSETPKGLEGSLVPFVTLSTVIT